MSVENFRKVNMHEWRCTSARGLTCSKISGYPRGMMYTASELVELATTYMAATGTTSSRLSKLAANNNRLFERLTEGYDCHSDMCERASNWFDENWPTGLEWPSSVTRRCTGNHSAAC